MEKKKKGKLKRIILFIFKVFWYVDSYKKYNRDTNSNKIYRKTYQKLYIEKTDIS